jgi:hypothetical protein
VPDPKTAATPGPTAREFEARLRELTANLGRERVNQGCVECVSCSGCNACTFCRDSERLVRSHYCVRCAMCTDCSHCRGSRGLIACHHCVDCEACSSSSYLVKCTALTNSLYCFGCVGLSGKEFHVLNEPYAKSDYFALTRRLSRELKL